MEAMPLEQAETDRREAWKRDALDAIATHAGTGREFTSDTLYEDGLPPAPHPNLVGPVLRRAADLGYIIPTGRVFKSRRRTRKGGWVAEYVGAHHMTTSTN